MKSQLSKIKQNTNARLRRVEKYISTHSGDVKADSSAVAFTPAVVGVGYFLSPISQGDTGSTRTGNAINMHEFSLGALFKMTLTCSVRIVVVQDRFNLGVIPSVTDVLDSSDVVSPLNYLNCVVTKRFKILEDYVEHFTIGGKLAASRRKIHKIDSKLYYSGPLNTAADARANNIYCVVLTDTPLAGQVNFYTRTQFTDE